MPRFLIPMLVLLVSSAGAFAQGLLANEQELLRDAKLAYELAEGNRAAEAAEVALATLDYGTALLRVAEAEEGRKILQLALKRYTDLYGKNSPELVSTLLMLAQAEEPLGPPSASRRHLERSRKIVARAFDAASIDYADYMYRIGRISAALSFYESAYEDLYSARQVYFSKLDPMSMKLGEIERLLGTLYLKDRKIDEAMPHLRRALTVFDPLDPARIDRHIRVRVDWGGALESLGLRDEATVHYVEIGRLQESLNPSQMLPVFRVAPDYPESALAAGISGYVDWEFTVDENGYVVNPQVVHIEGSSSFEKASLAALLRFRYPPRFVNGQAVATPGVTSQISFMIRH